MVTTSVSDSDPRLIAPLTHVCRYWRSSTHPNPDGNNLYPAPERDGVVPLAVNGDMDLFGSSHPHIAGATDLSLAGLESSVGAVANDLPGLFASLTLNPTSLELRKAEEPLDYSHRTDPPCQNHCAGKIGKIVGSCWKTLFPNAVENLSSGWKSRPQTPNT